MTNTPAYTLLPGSIYLSRTFINTTDTSTPSTHNGSGEIILGKLNPTTYHFIPSGLSIGTPFTIELWFKPEWYTTVVNGVSWASSLISTIGFDSTTGANSGWHLYLTGTSATSPLTRLVFNNYRSGKSFYSNFFPNLLSLPTPNAWHHIALVYNPTNSSSGNFYFYVDGYYYGTAPLTSVDYFTDNSAVLQIGVGGTSPAYWLKGKVTRIRISTLVRYHYVNGGVGLQFTPPTSLIVPSQYDTLFFNILPNEIQDNSTGGTYDYFGNLVSAAGDWAFDTDHP